MTEGQTIWVGGGDGSTLHLVADLGLYHHRICFDNCRAYLETIKETLQPEMNCPLKIIESSELIGLKIHCSGCPAGFTRVRGDTFVPDLPY